MTVSAPIVGTSSLEIASAEAKTSGCVTANWVEQVAPSENPSTPHASGLLLTRKCDFAHATTSVATYVSTFPSVESTHIGFDDGAPSWSGEMTIGANPWCAAAKVSSTVARPPKVKRSDGLPGWPEKASTTGSTGGCAVRAAGGR